jgi:hypothetical protein
MQTNVSIPAASPEIHLSFFRRLGCVFLEPSKTFEDIGRHPSWLGVFIIMSLLAMTSSYVLMSRMDYDAFVRKGLQMNPLTRNMSEEQISQITSRPRSAFQQYSGMIFAPLGILVEFFIFAGIFLLAFILTGDALPYKKALSVTYWGMAPPMIVVTLLSTAFMFIKDPETLELNPANNVISNLARLVDEKAHPALSSLLGSFDLFSFWTIALLSVGFAAVSNRQITTKKAATVVLSLWAVWVLGKAGFYAILG